MNQINKYRQFIKQNDQYDDEEDIDYYPEYKTVGDVFQQFQSVSIAVDNGIIQLD